MVNFYLTFVIIKVDAIKCTKIKHEYIFLLSIFRMKIINLLLENSIIRQI